MTLSVSFAHQFDNLNLDINFRASNGITVLFGRSGTGKTTAINAVAGLFRPDRAYITLDDKTLHDSERRLFVPAYKRRLGYVFQDDRIFPHLTVQQNLEFGAGRAPDRNSGPSTSEIADLLGITALLQRTPHALSGGEKQRVAIGRALLARPRILLMDEPLASLDSLHKAEILPYLERLRELSHLPILYVSHSVAEVARLANAIIIVDDGQITCSGSAEQVLSDPDMVRQFGIRDAGALLTAHVITHHPDGLSELETSGGRILVPRINTSIGAVTRLRILAQDIILSLSKPRNISALNILQVHVTAMRKGLGPGVVVQLSYGTDRLLARITRRSAEALHLHPGDKLFAIVKSVSIAQADIGFGS